MRPLLLAALLLASCAAPGYSIRVAGPLRDGPCYVDPAPGRESCAERWARWRRGQYHDPSETTVQVEHPEWALTMDDLLDPVWP